MPQDVPASKRRVLPDARHGLIHIDVLLSHGDTPFFRRLEAALKRSAQMLDKRIILHRAVVPESDAPVVDAILHSRRKRSGLIVTTRDMAPVRDALAAATPEFEYHGVEVKTQDNADARYRAVSRALKQDDLGGIYNSGYGSAGIEAALKEFSAVGKGTRQGASAFIIAAHSVIVLAAESKSRPPAGATVSTSHAPGANGYAVSSVIRTREVPVRMALFAIRCKKERSAWRSIRSHTSSRAVSRCPNGSVGHMDVISSAGLPASSNARRQ